MDAYNAGGNSTDGLSLTTIQRALYNTFQIRFRLGLFDPLSTQPWRKLNVRDDVDTAEAQQLNAEASRQGLILLQNKASTLPFAVPKRARGGADTGTVGDGKVVVVGGSANSARLFGGGQYTVSSIKDPPNPAVLN